GVGDEVVRAADAGLGDLDQVVGDLGGDPLEGAAVDLEGLEVAGVDADDLGTGVDRALDLLLVVDLDERGEADGPGALDEGLQGRLVEGGDDQQREVGAVRAGLPELVGGDDEVLAQDRDVHPGADRLQGGQRAAEAALLGEHGDHGRAARLVVGGEAGRVGDRGERALGGAGALDLADHLDAVAAQRGGAVLGGGGLRGALLELVEADARLPLREVGPHSVDDLVEHTHASGPLPDGWSSVRWFRVPGCPPRWSGRRTEPVVTAMVSAAGRMPRIRLTPVPLAGHPPVDQGCSQPPNGRFRRTVKTSSNAPSDHRSTGPGSIRNGLPRAAWTTQTVHSTAKPA